MPTRSSERFSRACQITKRQLDEEWGKDPHDEFTYQKLAEFNYEDVVRSLILQLGDASKDDEYALALFALDDAGSVILPLGFLNVDQLRSQQFVALPSPSTSMLQLVLSYWGMMSRQKRGGCLRRRILTPMYLRTIRTWNSIGILLERTPFVLLTRRIRR